MALSVTRLLRSRGYQIPLHKNVQATYNVVSGGYEAEGIQTFDFQGVFINFSTEEIDGTNVLATDRKLLIDAGSLSSIPAVGDMVSGSVVQGKVVGGSKIMSVRDFVPNGVTVAYTCQVR